MPVFAEDLQELIAGGTGIHEDHIDTRDHHVSGAGIAEIKDVVDHLFFFNLDDAFFLADTDQSAELSFGHRGSFRIRIHVKHFHDLLFQKVHYKNDRCQKDHEPVDDRCIGKRKFFRLHVRQRLWRDLAEQEDDKGQYSCCKTDKGVSEQLYRNGCSQSRYGHIYDVVADQDRTQHFAGVCNDF